MTAGMSKAQAAQSVASQLGISDASQIEIIDVRLDHIEHHGKTIVYVYKITYRLTAKGATVAATVVDKRIAPVWMPTQADISRFQGSFASKPNADRIISAMQGGYMSRMGSKHVADVAQTLGPNLITGFEVTYRPINGSIGFIDIQTQGRVPIECKSRENLRPLKPWELSRSVPQSANRLISPFQGAANHGVILAYPDGTLSQVREEILRYEKAYPGLRISERTRVLDLYGILGK